MTRIPVLLIASLLAATSTEAANKDLLGTAKTVVVLWDVEWNKQRTFNSSAELRSMRVAIENTPLYAYFRPLQKGSDIVLKFHEDQTFIDRETISLTVYDPDDNGTIYSESRPLIAVDNDIDRLVSHFLSAVDAARAPYRLAEESAAEQRQSEKEALLATAPKGATYSQVLQTLKSGKISARPGGMRVIFDSRVDLETRKQLLLVLNVNVEDESLKDPGYTISFSSVDGSSVSYKVTYRGETMRSSGDKFLSPRQFQTEIDKNW